jgi:hypothetical protein
VVLGVLNACSATDVFSKSVRRRCIAWRECRRLLTVLLASQKAEQSLQSAFCVIGCPGQGEQQVVNV